MTLFEIDAAIMDCIDEETGEIVNIEQLEALQMEREKKIENVALWYKNLVSDAEQYKQQKEAFAAREQAAKKKADSLKQYLANALNGEKFKTIRAEITFRNSEAVNIADEGAFIEWAEKEHDEYLTYKPPVINKTAIKAAIKSGAYITGAELVGRKNISIK